jgi:hypothetical protein
MISKQNKLLLLLLNSQQNIEIMAIFWIHTNENSKNKNLFLISVQRLKICSEILKTKKFLRKKFNPIDICYQNI